MVSLVSFYKPPFSHSRSLLTYSRLCFIHQRAGVRVCWKPGTKKKKLAQLTLWKSAAEVACCANAVSLPAYVSIREHT